MKVPIDAGEYYPVTERRGTGTRFRPHTLPAADAAAEMPIYQARSPNRFR